MATFYSIHAYDRESKYYAGEDRINDGKLYTTFEKACEVIERKIQAHIEYFNCEEENEVFQPPNREEMRQRMGKGKYVNYYETNAGWIWVISKWEVAKSEDPSCENCDQVKPLRLYPSRSDPNVWYRYCDECFPC